MAVGYADILMKMMCLRVIATQIWTSQYGFVLLLACSPGWEDWTDTEDRFTNSTLILPWKFGPATGHLLWTRFWIGHSSLGGWTSSTANLWKKWAIIVIGECSLFLGMVNMTINTHIHNNRYACCPVLYVFVHHCWDHEHYCMNGWQIWSRIYYLPRSLPLRQKLPGESTCTIKIMNMEIIAIIYCSHVLFLFITITNEYAQQYYHPKLR